MTAIALTVNGSAVDASVDPRTHLADFVRDGLHLTGTHLGCEHGVCGACTLLLDDMPARSCITYAVSCGGARVTTIEGLDDDEIATELRAAFTREHALQCGYCTPGMLISARDLVRRLPEADEQSIRVGMSGNLCRCTGYVGIVKAIRSVIALRRERGIAPEPGAGRVLLGPVGSGSGGSLASTVQARVSLEVPAETAVAMVVPDFTPATVITDHFTVPYPPAKVFDLFGDVAAVARCLPSVTLIGVPRPDYAEGMIQVRIGPIAANFRGAARIERMPKTWSGRIVGIGNDQRSRSTSQGEIRYRLEAIEADATRVEISIGYSLRGMLAQMAREGLVRELVSRLTADFSRNLDRHLSGAEPEVSSEAGQGLNGLSLLTHALRQYVSKIFSRSRS